MQDREEEKEVTGDGWGVGRPFSCDLCPSVLPLYRAQYLSCSISMGIFFQVSPAFVVLCAPY